MIYPELSYKIIGIAFKIFNEIGYGPKEKYFQRIFALELLREGMKYKKELCVDLIYQDHSVGKYFLDFVVEDKIIVELKVRPKLGYVYARQVIEYLKRANKKLAILIFFTKDGVKYRRIVNPNIEKIKD